MKVKGRHLSYDIGWQSLNRCNSSHPRLCSIRKRKAIAKVHSKEIKCNYEESVETPLIDAILERASRDWESPFYVPGHKKGTSASPMLVRVLGKESMRNDTTELKGLDNLQEPCDVIAESMRLASTLWDADKTWFLVNGATAGIHAAIMAVCRRGKMDGLIISRNAHQSAHNAVAIIGCTPFYTTPFCSYEMAHHVEPEQLEEAFKRCIEANIVPRAALVVSPTYYGVISDIPALRKVCDTYNATLIVDEAHGAHLQFLFPETKIAYKTRTSTGNEMTRNWNGLAALQGGAHLVIQSTHKQLSSLTQSAMLHAKDIDASLATQVTKMLRMIQSSSPSYLLMASLDGARHQIQENPRRAVLESHIASQYIRFCFDKGNFSRENLSLQLLEPPAPNVRIDPWRLTILVKDFLPHGATGWSLASLLENRQGIVAEMATRTSFVLACGIGTTQSHAKHLEHALHWLVHEEGWKDACGRDAIPSTPFANDTYTELDARHQSITPGEVLRSETRPIPLKTSIGKICAETVSSYPPGIPILLPGEEITNAHILHIAEIKDAGGQIIGLHDDNHTIYVSEP